MNADEVKRFKEFKWTKRKVLRLFASCLLWGCGPAYLFCSLAAWNLNFAVWHWFLRGVLGVSLFLFVPLAALCVAVWIELRRKDALLRSGGA